MEQSDSKDTIPQIQKANDSVLKKGQAIPTLKSPIRQRSTDESDEEKDKKIDETKPKKSDKEEPGPLEESDEEVKVRLIVKGRKPAAPKKPMPAYFQFQNWKRAEFMKRFPELKGVQIVKKMSEAYKDFTSEEKKIYEDMATRAKERYDREVKDYNEKYGLLKEKKRGPHEEEDSDYTKKKRNKKDKREPETKAVRKKVQGKKSLGKTSNL